VCTQKDKTADGGVIVVSDGDEVSDVVVCALYCALDVFSNARCDAHTALACTCHISHTRINKRHDDDTDDHFAFSASSHLVAWHVS
jgi:hypothetical protein